MEDFPVTHLTSHSIVHELGDGQQAILMRVHIPDVTEPMVQVVVGRGGCMLSEDDWARFKRFIAECEPPKMVETTEEAAAPVIMPSGI